MRALLLVPFLLTWLPGSSVVAAARPSLTAPDAIVVDGWSGATLYAKHADAIHYPASTVKVMTALLVMRSHIPLGRVVTVSADAAAYGGSTAGLYAGERLSLRNLMYAMLLPSGNDAAIALAEAVAGTTISFVARMNAEAVRLHLRHTHFLTPNGFDMTGQFTSARDLATLARVAMQHRFIAHVVRTRVWSIYAANGAVVHRWVNLNKLLWSSPLVDGVKTGTTPGAGACLVLSTHQGGRWVISVNLGSTVAARFSDGAALLNYGLAVDTDAPSTR